MKGVRSRKIQDRNITVGKKEKKRQMKRKNENRRNGEARY